MNVNKTVVFAATLPIGLKDKVSEVCELLGMRKNFLIEAAIREKLEDLIDAYDLRQAVKEATGFHSWESVKKNVYRRRS